MKGEITVGDSSVSVSEASEIARNSDWDSGCDILGILKGSAALDDSSLSADTSVSSLPSPQMDSGKAPESLNDDFISCGDTAEPNSDGSCKDQACSCSFLEEVQNFQE